MKQLHLVLDSVRGALFMLRKKEEKASGVQCSSCSAKEVLKCTPECFVLWQPSSAPSLSLTD